MSESYDAEARAWMESRGFEPTSLTITVAELAAFARRAHEAGRREGIEASLAALTSERLTWDIGGSAERAAQERIRALLAGGTR